MQQKYDWPDKISDEAITEAFANAEIVSFSARRFNSVQFRAIGLEGLEWWLPLVRVLPLVGITPQMLRPVFNLLAEVELPEEIESYEQLGNFPLTEEHFLKLAKVLGKSVVVMREDGTTGGHYYLFTAHPSGEIVEVERS